MAIHFIGFRGEEYHSAIRVWGPPDLIHRWADKRFWLGGELCPGDTCVFANGEETHERDPRYSFNDSECL